MFRLCLNRLGARLFANYMSITGLFKTHVLGIYNFGKIDFLRCASEVDTLGLCRFYCVILLQAQADFLRL